MLSFNKTIKKLLNSALPQWVQLLPMGDKTKCKFNKSQHLLARKHFFWLHLQFAQEFCFIMNENWNLRIAAADDRVRDVCDDNHELKSDDHDNARLAEADEWRPPWHGKRTLR